MKKRPVGRPRIPGGRVKVGLSVRTQTAEDITMLAEKHKVTKSKLIELALTAFIMKDL